MGIKISEWIETLEREVGVHASDKIEDQYINAIGFAGSLAGVISLIFVPFSSLSLTLKISSIAGVLFILLVFFLNRFTRYKLIAKIILSILAVLMLNILFFYNYGSNGPLLYYAPIILLILYFIWPSPVQWIVCGLVLANILFFSIIEYFKLDFVTLTAYADEKSRIADNYRSFFLFLIVGGGMLSLVRRSYLRDKKIAEQSDKLKSSFLANMSHEIRTPMNTILGFSQLLEEETSKEKRKKFAGIINENGKSLLRLIDDIIDISSIEAGKLEIKRSEGDLNLLMESLKSTFSQFLETHQIYDVQLIVTRPYQSARIITDFERLKQVMTNLIHNAIKYTEEGTVEFGYAIVFDRINFFVKDTGTGIKQENLARIFERFHKVEEEHSMKIQRGTGIGLALSSNLVRLLGGELMVNSIFGKGSDFYFSIPLIPAAGPAIKVTNPVTENSAEVNLKGKVVLIVEDDDTSYQFLEYILSSLGIIIYRAGDGEEAIRIFTSGSRVDLVLMDIMLPLMNGYEATREIKKIAPDVPVIVQTALAMDSDKQLAYEAGCDGCLTKPLQISVVMNEINRLLKR